MKITIYVLVEGPTEKRFVDEILNPHLKARNIRIEAIILKTREDPNIPAYRGGTIKYNKAKKQLNELLRCRNTYVTTMLDFYALHPTFWENVKLCGKSVEKATQIEQHMLNDIDHERRFIPYIQLHEFEGLLFSSPNSIASQFDNTEKLEIKLNKIKKQFRTPEEINNNPNTCPSSRLERLCKYVKPFHGPLIAKRIGLEIIRSECPHFNEWLSKLENLSDLIAN